MLSGRPEAGCLDDLLGLDGGNVDEEADDGTAICPSDEEAPGFLQEDIGADRVLHSDDDDMIFIKKRKRVISDDEESDRLSDVGQLEDVDDGGPPEKVRSNLMFVFMNICFMFFFNNLSFVLFFSE